MNGTAWRLAIITRKWLIAMLAFGVITSGAALIYASDGMTAVQDTPSPLPDPTVCAKG